MLERLDQIINVTRDNHQNDDLHLIEKVIRAIEENSPAVRSVEFRCSSRILSYGSVPSADQVTLVAPNEDAIKRILKAVEKNTQLVEFTLVDYSFTHEEEIKILGESIAKNTSITKLQLNYCGFCQSAADALAFGLENNWTIQSLHLTGSVLLSASLRSITQGLIKNQFITELDCTNFICNGAMVSQLEAAFHWWRETSTLDSVEKWLKRNQNFQVRHKRCQGKLKKFKKLCQLYINCNNSHQAKKILESIQNLFAELENIVNKLQTLDYKLAGVLLHQLRYVQAEFYLATNEIAQFTSLYYDYFTAHHDDEIYLKYFTCIFTCQDQNELNFIGLHEDSLRYRYIIKLLEDKKEESILKSVLAKWQKKGDSPSTLSFEQTIGVDAILTNKEVIQLKKCLELLSNTSSEFSDFLQELKKQLSEKDDGTSIKLFKRAPVLANETEAYIVKILINIFENKKITTYAEVRQKAGKPVDLLSLSVDEQNQIQLHLVPDDAATTIGKEIFVDKIENQVRLKYWLAEGFKDSVYQKIFDSLPLENVACEHSRILSASRLVKLSSEHTYEQMMAILQVEYYSLPNSDKQSSHFMRSFFTSYRCRTLEQALESVFAQAEINFISNDEINESEKLQVASDILHWIGKQERSFYFKKLKKPELLQSMQTLGEIAHQMIVCNCENQFSQLKADAQTELDKFPFIGSLCGPLLTDAKVSTSLSNKL